jgi:hypothetical protein
MLPDVPIPDGIRASFQVLPGASAKASDGRNKLNKIKNNLGLSMPFIINVLIFF